MQLVIASNNVNKVSEIRAILDVTEIEVVSYGDVFDEVIDVVEDGETFRENAQKKVMAFPERSDFLYLGEDAGLEVDALGGKPGIYSARYAGEGAIKEDLCNKILVELGDELNRKARFRSVMALRFPCNKIEFREGIVEGSIAKKIRGEHGFGYDQIFMPDGFQETFGEISQEEKNRLSHRYRALVRIKELLSIKSF